MLKVQQFCFNPFQENTYVVYNGAAQCIIVDPGCSNSSEERALSDFITSEQLDVMGIWCTHCHIDHVMGLDFAAGYFGLKPMVPAGELSVLAAAGRTAELYGIPYKGTPEVDTFSGSSLAMGADRFELLQVPGHSPGHVAFYHKESATLIAGDVLFRRSIGRSDLPGGDYDTLIRSIREVFFQLPDDTKVYAGHMEPTTIGEERRYNPFLT